MEIAADRRKQSDAFSDGLENFLARPPRKLSQKEFLEPITIPNIMDTADSKEQWLSKLKKSFYSKGIGEKDREDVLLLIEALIKQMRLQSVAEANRWLEDMGLTPLNWKRPKEALILGQLIETEGWPFSPPRTLQEPYFVDREQELQQLEDHLLDFRDGELGRMLRVALVGPHGIGKTRLAREFVERHGSRFPGATFWLNMGKRENVVDQLREWFRRRGVVNDRDKEPAVLSAAREFWEHTAARMLVFDNFEGADAAQRVLLAELLPREGGSRVLVTSTSTPWSPGGSATITLHTLPIGPLPRPASLLLLLTPRAIARGATVERLLDDDNSKISAASICDKLLDRPWALQLAANALAENLYEPLPDYYANLTDDVLHQRTGLFNDPAFRPMKLAFESIYEKLAAYHGARTLLHLVAQCAPEPIPCNLMQQLRVACLNQSGDSTGSDPIDTLRRLGLLETPVNAETPMKLDPLFAEFAQLREHRRNNGEDRKTVAEALLTVGRLLVKRTNDVGELGEGTLLIPHLRFAIERADAPSSTRTVMLHHILGQLSYFRGERREAVVDLERAWDMAQKLDNELEAGHRAALLYDLGTACSFLGRIDKAESYMRRAVSELLMISEMTTDSTDSPQADYYNSLGGILMEKGVRADREGRHDEADETFVDAIKYFELALNRVEPQGIPHTIFLNNLAQAYHKRKDLRKARELYGEALKSARALARGSKDSMLLADTQAKLGVLLLDLGEIEKGYGLLRRALNVREKKLEPNHPDLATSYFHTARAMRLLGKSNVEAYLRRARTIRWKLYGTADPATLEVEEELKLLSSPTPPQAEEDEPGTPESHTT